MSVTAEWFANDNRIVVTWGREVVFFGEVRSDGLEIDAFDGVVFAPEMLRDIADWVKQVVDETKVGRQENG